MTKLLKAARVGSFILVLAVFAIVLSFADIKKMADAFIGIKWRWAISVPLLNLANTFVEGLRLAVILLPVSARFELRNCFTSVLVGIMGNIMLPLRFGDGARACYIAKTERISLAGSFSALMLDRIADFVLFFALMAITAVLYPFPPSVTKTGLNAGFIFAVTIAAIFALAGIGSHLGRNSSGKIRRRIAEEASKFMNGLSVVRKAGLVFPIILTSALSWLLRALMLWCIFEAFSLDLPFIATPIVLILLNLKIALVSTPANMGGFEIAIAGTLNQLFSVEIEVALSCAVALHAIEVAPTVAFGTIYLWWEGFKTAEILKTANDMGKEQSPQVSTDVRHTSEGGQSSRI